MCCAKQYGVAVYNRLPLAGWAGWTSPLDFAGLDACDVQRRAVMCSSGPHASTVLLPPIEMGAAAVDCAASCWSLQKYTRCCAATANVVLHVISSKVLLSYNLYTRVWGGGSGGGVGWRGGWERVVSKRRRGRILLEVLFGSCAL